MSVKTHGKTESAEYNSWMNMRGRCKNPNNDKYKWYGAIGIKVCDRWTNSFENFLADMGEKTTPKHSLDRINVHGNYEPTNCRWATQKNNVITSVAICLLRQTALPKLFTNGANLRV